MASAEQPAPRPGRAHQLQSFASGPAMLLPPYCQPLQPIVPDQLRGRPARAHALQSFASPGVLAVPTVLQPLQPVTPIWLRGRPKRAHEIPSFFSPGRYVTPVTPPIASVGPIGAATFVLALGQGTKITFLWATSLTRSYSGRETRSSPYGQPGRRIEGPAFLVDAGSRDARGALVRAASTGAIFALALPFEALLITADSPSSVITVSSTTQCDWALVGQRVVVLGVDDTTVSAVIQSTTATTITVAPVDAYARFTFVALGSTGRAGGQVMPLIPVLLDPQQGFARYPVTVDLWSLNARAATPGFSGIDAMGIGAAIATFPDGDPVAVASLTDDDLLIWDRPNAIEGTANESLLLGTELVDLGAVPWTVGGQLTAEWGRQLKLRSQAAVDWQWCKAFLRHVRGRQGSFLLSTNRPDLIPVSNVGGVFKIASPLIAGAGDYTSWFASTGHRRLAVTAGGVVQYAEVTAVADNRDGTLTLTLPLDTVLAGTVTQVSFLEQVRFDRDAIEVTWDGSTFALDETLLTTIEPITPPPRPMFDVVLTPPPYPRLASVPYEITPVLGNTTIINLEGVDGPYFGIYYPDYVRLAGIAAVGGNVDGMIVCLVAVNLSIFVNSEDTNAAATSRFLFNAGVGRATGQFGWLMVRYNGALGRWLAIT